MEERESEWIERKMVSRDSLWQHNNMEEGSNEGVGVNWGQMGSNEGHVWVSLGGVVHVDLSEGFFGLIVRISLRHPLKGWRDHCIVSYNL